MDKCLTEKDPSIPCWGLSDLFWTLLNSWKNRLKGEQRKPGHQGAPKKSQEKIPDDAETYREIPVGIVWCRIIIVTGEGGVEVLGL